MSETQLERIEKLSQEIFGKPSKDLKYVYVTNYIHQQLLEEELARTGLYQWINVFKGEVKYPRDINNYNDYDIVHMNMSAQDIYLMGTIKEQLKGNKHTKLVVNNDYTTELWGRTFEYTDILTRELQYPDMIFGTEYFQATALSELSGRLVNVIPHPADIKRMKALTPKPRKPIISTIWRRYDNHSYIPSLATRNHGLTNRLLGYDEKIDPKTFLTLTLYDYVQSGTNFFDFCDQLRESEIVYDPFTFHSYSRATVDTAALKVPVVGSNRTQSMNICYPYTLVDPYDVKTSRELIKRLAEDKKFREKVVNTAYEKCEYYNHENSMERFLSGLKESIKDNKERIKIKPKKIKPKKGSGEDVLHVLAKKINKRHDELKIK